jgi:hypothetical protein
MPLALVEAMEAMVNLRQSQALLLCEVAVAAVQAL